MRSSALALLACATIACGSSGTGAPTASATTDASPSIGDDADAASPDAPDDPGSDVYPAPHPLAPPMVDYGGALLTSLKLVTVVFQGSAFKEQLALFGATIVQSQWLRTVTDGYPVQPTATHAGVFELPDTVSGQTLAVSSVATVHVEVAATCVNPRSPDCAETAPAANPPPGAPPPARP